MSHARNLLTPKARVVALLMLTVAIGAAYARPASQPAATRPAAAPTTQPVKAKLGPLLRQRWRWYKAVWAGRDIASQSRADQQFVGAILKADPAEVATLRDEMAAEYNRLAGIRKPDDFQLGRLAARLVQAWRRVPMGKQLDPAQRAINMAMCARETCRWGKIALEHLGGEIPGQTLEKYRGFVPGTAASVVSLMMPLLGVIDKPGDLREAMLALRGSLQALLPYSGDRQAETGRIIDNFYQALAPMELCQADKDAVRKLIDTYRTAYNARDTKAFTALWPEGHPSVAILRAATLDQTIPADCWAIIRWDCAYIVVNIDKVDMRKYQAEAFVVMQYRGKDGKAGPVRLQGYHAHKESRAGWKLGSPLIRPTAGSGSPGP